MAAEWDGALGAELGMGVYAGTVLDHYGNIPPPEPLRVDDLLDLPSGHEFFPVSSCAAGAAAAGGDGGRRVVVKSEPSDQVTSYGSRHLSGESTFSLSQFSFVDQFYIPTEEAAELEWLSKFVDDSYSDVPSNNYSSSSLAAAQSLLTAGKTTVSSDAALAAPGRGARSKRSRAAAVSVAAAAWHSLAPSPNSTSPSSSSSSSDFPPSKPSSQGEVKDLRGLGVEISLDGGVRRCTHCASEKTPQWRTGPLGPKTLCNACGVRYKSGRLLPEYRPAASPTFILTQHSNSHRKVVELRRQKELLLLRHRDHSAAAADGHAAAAGRHDLIFHGYGVC